MSDQTQTTAKLEIRHNESGEVRVHPQTWDWDGDDFIWSEGNFSCDCNRGDFFAQGIGDNEDQDVICGNDKYSVRLTAIDGGAVLYQDGEWASPDAALRDTP